VWAVASGLGNARKLVEAIRSGEVAYDFVEIMACPGGCAGGGGQPIHEGMELAAVRGGNLYGIDSHSTLRHSHENPDIIRIYDEFLGEPLSHKAHELLHTDHKQWRLDIWP
jgi:NADH-quinone oxidoreductase subunit G